MFKITNYKIYKHAWIDKRAPHFGEKLDAISISELLSNGGIMVRNTYDFDCDKETSFWYVINVYTNLKVYHFLIKKCTTPNRLQRYA